MRSSKYSVARSSNQYSLPIASSLSNKIIKKLILLILELISKTVQSTQYAVTAEHAPSRRTKTKWLNCRPPKNWWTLLYSLSIYFLKVSCSSFLSAKNFSIVAMSFIWLSFVPCCSFRPSKTSLEMVYFNNVKYLSWVLW